MPSIESFPTKRGTAEFTEDYVYFEESFSGILTHSIEIIGSTKRIDLAVPFSHICLRFQSASGG